MNIFPRMMRDNTILSSSITIGLITIIVKLLGYAEKVVLAYYFGTSYEVDVYNVILAIILGIFVFFREVIEPGFLNIFLRGLGLKKDNEVWNLFNFFIKKIFLITLILSVFAYFFPGKIIEVFAPGFENEKRELATNLLQIGFPACIFLSLSALTGITLNGLKKFALPTSGELVFKIFILLSLALLYKYHGIYAAVIGVLLGSIARLFVHLIPLFKKISLRRSAVQPGYLKDTWMLSWPLLLGVLFSQVSAFIDNIFASYLHEGAISALNYSKKIVELPVLIFPYILSIVVFPYFTELSLTNEKERLAKLFVQSISWITLIFLPLSLFFHMFSYEIVELVFERGAFKERSTLLTSLPLKYYSVGMLFFAIETVLVVFYFAKANTKTPVLIGIICVIENVLLMLALVKTLGYTGIALAFVISKSTKTIILLSILKDSLNMERKFIVSFLFKAVLACLMVYAGICISKIVFQPVLSSSFISKAAFLGLTFLFSTAIYVLSLFLFKVNKNLILSNTSL